MADRHIARGNGDGTYLPQFICEWAEYVVVIFDRILWTVIALVTLAVFLMLGLVYWPAFAGLTVAKRLVLQTRRLNCLRACQRCWPRWSSYPVAHPELEGDPSYVNLSSPNLLRSLLVEYATTSHHLVATRDTANRYSVHTSSLLLQFCALVYENKTAVGAREFPVENGGPVPQGFVQHFRPQDDDAGAYFMEHVAATALVFYDANQRTIVVAFKGTGPFNLSEWLSDFRMIRTSPASYALPGMVHEGFYSALEFTANNTYEHPQFSLDGVRDHTAPQFQRILAGIADAAAQLGEVRNLWITGHSLGAAMASLFFAHLIYSRLRYLADDSRGRRLKYLLQQSDMVLGAYVFGCPRTGNTDYHAAIETLRDEGRHPFFRVINGTDPVGSVPLGVQYGPKLTNVLRACTLVKDAGRQSIRKHHRMCQHNAAQAGPGAATHAHAHAHAPTPRAPLGGLAIFPPSAESLLDYCFIGDPVFISRWGRGQFRERTLADYWRSVASFGVSTLALGFADDTFTMWALRFLTLGVAFDHIPGVYYHNIRNGVQGDLD